MAANIKPAKISSLLILCVIFHQRCVLVDAISLDQLEDQLREEKRSGKVLLVSDLLSRPHGQHKENHHSDGEHLGIFCNPGLRKRDLWRLWTSYTLRLSPLTDAYTLYTGPNATDVFRQHKEASALWLHRIMPWRTEAVTLAVFNRSCVGISSEESYRVNLIHKTIDPWLVGFLVTGFVLFFLAKRLSRNVMFYYGTGLSLGLVASLLILIFIVSRYVPKRVGAYSLLIGGWSLTLWLLQYVWENVQQILEEYMIYVAGYFCVTGLCTLAYLYYKGPVTNPRMLDLITWALQGVALLLMYHGTQIPEVSATIMAAVIVLHLIKLPTFSPRSYSFCGGYSRWGWFPRFAPRPRLLTEEEYMQQGREETRRALDDLKEYCRSPDCDAWRTMSRLNSPQRFAKWVEGSSHLSEDELMAFDADPAPLNFDETDDSEHGFGLPSH